MADFTIAAAQSSSVAGDIAANIDRHKRFVLLADKYGADVIVFPELSLTGYEPTLAADVALSPDDSALEPLQDLSDNCQITIIVGCPIRSDGPKPYLGAFIVRPSRPIEVYRKRFLHPPHEPKYFVASDDVVVCSSHGQSIGVAICADINNPAHPADVHKKHATVYAAGVAMTPSGIVNAEKNMKSHAEAYGMLTVMANYGAPTGEFEMAGRSGIWDENGKLVAQAGAEGESVVLAKNTKDGWRGCVCNDEMNGSP